MTLARVPREVEDSARGQAALGSKSPEVSSAKKMYRSFLAPLKKIRRTAQGNVLQMRWTLGSRSLGSKPVEGVPQQDSLSLLDVSVINLDHRADRLKSVSEEMAKLGVSHWRRVSAVNGKAKYANLEPLFAGSIACSESHIQAISSTDWSRHRAAMVCEDDLEILVNRGEISRLISEFLENPLLSVLCLSGRARGGSFPISKRLKVATGVVGRGCYIIKPDVAQPLIAAFESGVPQLLLGRVGGKGDQRWATLQRRGFFFAFPHMTTAQQRAGYSDIEDKLLGPR